MMRLQTNVQYLKTKKKNRTNRLVRVLDHIFENNNWNKYHK